MKRTGNEWATLIRQKTDTVAQVLWNGERFNDSGEFRMTAGLLASTATKQFATETTSLDSIAGEMSKACYEGMDPFEAAQLLEAEINRAV